MGSGFEGVRSDRGRSSDSPNGPPERKRSPGERPLSSRSTSSDPPTVQGVLGRRASPHSVQEFRLLGMSVREAKMYLAFLSGSRRAREATALAGLHRATGYRILTRLLDRGMVTGDGQNPQRFEAVDPSTLFHRLELFYRDEAEIPSSIAEALGHGNGEASGYSPFLPAPIRIPRILANDGLPTHPIIEELSGAKHSVVAVVRPLSTPVAYRNALARALGRLARRGVHVRLITDALPADHRFCRAVAREAGGASVPLEMRHYSPLASQLYSIDRQKVVRIPTLGATNRAPPVGVAVDDLSRVQLLVNRFETLWREASGSSRPRGRIPVSGAVSRLEESNDRGLPRSRAQT